MATQSVLIKPRVADFSRLKPIPDPPRIPDMMGQMPTIAVFLMTLDAWFRHRGDVFVGAGGYLLKTLDDRNGPYPDGSFAYGLEDPGWLKYRNGYVISEVGKPPDLVFEVGSESTGRRDYTVKRETYAEYGVGEYWRFDPSGGEYHDAPLAGDRLVDGEYEPIEIVSEPDGRHWGYSEAMGLEFWWVRDESLRWNEGELRFRDPVTGEFLRTPVESEEAAVTAEERAEYAERRAESERSARESAERRAESERSARESAEARVAELEAETRRLRGEE